MRYLSDILTISDKKDYTVYYWVSDVILKLIGEYAKFLNLKLCPNNLSK